MNEPTVRKGAIERVHQAIGEDTRVLVAHSLGTVVSYEALCQNSFKVHTFVTLGSPLGVQNSIFRRLNPVPSENRGCWPGHLRRWVNIAQPCDVVAIRKALAPIFSHPPEGGMEDFLVPDPSGIFQAHNAEHYLARSEVAGAVERGLASI
jgi:hypothetical protein